MRKYKNKKVVLDGKTFASNREAKRFQKLRLLEQAGAICDLQTQVKFVLIPAQREPDTQGPRGGIRRGRLIERECAYIADFCYRDENGFHVEDSKGCRTKDYVIKRKLMLFVHGIKIEEV